MESLRKEIRTWLPGRKKDSPIKKPKPKPRPSTPELPPRDEEAYKASISSIPRQDLPPPSNGDLNSPQPFDDLSRNDKAKVLCAVDRSLGNIPSLLPQCFHGNLVDVLAIITILRGACFSIAIACAKAANPPPTYNISDGVTETCAQIRHVMEAAVSCVPLEAKSWVVIVVRNSIRETLRFMSSDHSDALGLSMSTCFEAVANSYACQLICPHIEDISIEKLVLSQVFPQHG